jgi:acyl-CoA synthetase (AMP-forming)/AMP-acid ligase II/thioesterase domain-containing protein/acyl carrier protein
LSAILRRAADRFPEHGIVYIGSDGTEEFQTYPALVQEAERILAGLHGLGLKAQDKVIFQLDHHRSFIPAFWGCVLGGIVPLPIPVAPAHDYANSGVDGIYDVWELLEHPIILTTRLHADAIRSASKNFDMPGLHVETLESLINNMCDETWHEAQPFDLALLMLTSGSTGLPKAVMLNHSNLLASSAGWSSGNALSHADVFLNWMSLDHIAGIIFLVTSVFLGSRQIQASAPPILEDPLKWPDWIDRHRVSITFAPNFAYRLVNERAQDLPRRRWDLSCVRSMLNAGEAIVSGTARRFLELLGSHGLSPRVMCPTWGMAETCAGVTYSDRFALDSTSDDDRFVEVGSPITGALIRIVNDEDVPIVDGQIGSVQVKGPTITGGYYNNPELNRESFTTDGWFRTGDLGFLSGGCLTITGREKDVIIVNGIKYSSHQIETVVEGIEGVEPSYTVACAARKGHQGIERLVVFFHPSAGENSHLAALLEKIRHRVVTKLGVNPDYVIPVEKKDIPKTSIGKIQRTALSKRFEGGGFEKIVDRVRGLTMAACVPPRTPIEEALASIWAELLGLERVGIHDSFFDMGGHSLLIVRLISRIKKQFGVNLPVAIIFQYATIADFAKLLETDNWRHSGSSLIPIRSEGSKLPFFWIHGDSTNILLPDYLGPDQPLYGFEHQAADGKPARYTRVETIAKHYLDEVRTVQPHGPYLLGGYSFGSVISFEMAHQLKREGEEARLVFMLDPPPLMSRNGKPSQPPLMEGVKRHWQKLLHMGIREKLYYLAPRIKGRLRIRMPWMGKYFRKLRWNFYLAARLSLPASMRSEYMLDIYRRALRSYVPQPYSGRVTLCKSEEAWYPPSMDWMKLSTGKLDAYDFHGQNTHEDLKQEPYVAQWAQWLKDSLDSAQPTVRSRSPEEHVLR